MSEKIVQALEEFEAEAMRFASTLTPGESAATLVTLSGELGAGKTAYTKAVAQALGVTETVNSPTFVLEKIYQLTPKVGHPMSDFRRLIHIDAYRLEMGSDLIPLGFGESMQDPSNLILLEWPEKVADALTGLVHTRINIDVLANDARNITYG